MVGFVVRLFGNDEVDHFYVKIERFRGSLHSFQLELPLEWPE